MNRSLPPYIYGREAGPNERVWTEQAIRLYGEACAGREPQEIASREFTNELGNRIRITIEGPTSASENILTPMETEQLRGALNAWNARASDRVRSTETEGLGPEGEERGAEGMRPEKSSEREAPSVQVVEPMDGGFHDAYAEGFGDGKEMGITLYQRWIVNHEPIYANAAAEMLARFREHDAQASALPAAQQPAAADAVARIVHLRADRERRIYIAGPMTGLPEFNFPAFNAAAERLRADGWHVENPAEHGHIDGAEWADYLRWDLSRVVTVAAVYLLPGWPKSKGATLEVAVARALGLALICAPGAEDPALQPAVEPVAPSSGVRP